MRQIRLLKYLAAVLLAGALLLTPALAFTDTAGHWAETSVNKWSQEYGVLQGYDDGSFRPDDPITRGAFAGILDRFLQFQSIAPAGTFSDTKGNRWEDAILKLNATNVYLGTDGKALPGNSITRQQAMTMVARAFQLGGADGGALPYHDEAQLANYARPYIAEMANRGWITDAMDNSFRPTEPLTRAELVNLLNNMIQVLIQTGEPYSRNVDGSLLVNSAAGASLSNMTVTGDLLIAPGVTGSVSLDNVTVNGQLRNFSAVTPQITTTETQVPETPPTPEAPGTASSGEDFDWGIQITPPPPGSVSPDDDPTVYPGIQPSEVYTPGITTGQFIEYNGKQVPVYVGTEQSRLYPGDFTWSAEHPDRLVYNGSQFRTRFGIDVSAYQNRASTNEAIDWRAVRNDGVEFAFVRIGLRGYSSGKITEDAYYRRNIQGAMNAGIETGVYFFAQAITVEEAIEEADFVIEHLRGLNINGPVAYDWEMGDSSYRVYGIAPEMATACAIAFCNRIREAGYTPMIYQSTYVAYMKYDQGAVAPYLQWFPEYKSESSEKLCPTLYYQPDYWQFSSKCSVAGITGNVDVNIQFLPW